MSGGGPVTEPEATTTGAHDAGPGESAAADPVGAPAGAGADAVLDDALPEDQPAGPSEAPPADDPVETMRAERDEYLDALRRVQADFENYKKRIVRQQTEHLERAAEALVSKLLPVLDNLDLALAHIEPESDHGRAIGQIGASLIDVLSREGLEKVDPQGRPFDPTEAEAVMHEPGGESAAPEVVEVLRAGYRWRGRVIRPAMVKVKG